jgi:hypothetical protein
MGRLYLHYSDDDEVYVCKYCGTHIASASQVYSKVSCH